MKALLLIFLHFTFSSHLLRVYNGPQMAQHVPVDSKFKNEKKAAASKFPACHVSQCMNQY